ncbi:MAG: GGDEF domain-containing protein [Rhodococcus sp. (in: high G+C Gram-positive bacteria)]
MLAIVCLANGFSPSYDSQTDPAIVLPVLVVGFIVCIGAALVWARGDYLTRTQSRVFVVVGDAATAAFLLIQPLSVQALLLACLLMAMAQYVNAFHSSRLLVFHAVLSAAVTAIITVRLFVQTTVATADIISALLVVLIVQFGPSGINHLFLTALRHDAARAYFDQLTGLRNRHGLSVSVDLLVATTRNAAEPTATTVSAVCIDLDAFKLVNDRFGHATGDEVLCHIARRIDQESTRWTVTSRLGGEEFLLVVVGDEAEGSRIADRLVRSIYRRDDDIAPVSASIGVASEPLAVFGPDTGRALERLMDRADTAMYSAKRQGGNKVALFSEAQTDGVGGG